jgi:signal-transduction protein with cAMP-binding, CBS, and nucleotidyltransferase domain
VARLSTMPTIPDDAALQDLMVGWSLDVVEPGPTNQPLFVAKLMRTPAVLSEHASLGAVAKLFADGMEGPVVIVSDENEPLGILTPAHVLRMVNERPAEELEQVRLRDMAITNGPVLAQNTPVRDAAERFAARGCDTLVVVKPDGKLAGVLMARDLCRLCV